MELWKIIIVIGKSKIELEIWKYFKKLEKILIENYSRILHMIGCFTHSKGKFLFLTVFFSLTRVTALNFRLQIDFFRAKNYF